MAKQSGLGDNLYVAGWDFSGDWASIQDIGGGPAPLVVTGIDKSAFERIGGQRDGRLNATSYFNPAAGQAHPRLSLLPRTDVILSYCRGTTLGNPAACINAKQTNYDPTRAADGSFTFNVSALGNSFGLEWGVQLTAGKRTDTAATNGTGVDLTTVSTAFGLTAYLHSFSFVGTDVTVKIQDSADNISFADVTGAAFTQITSATPSAERIATASSQAVRRYLRAVTVTTGGFTSLVFAVTVNRFETAVTF